MEKKLADSRTRDAVCAAEVSTMSHAPPSAPRTRDVLDQSKVRRARQRQLRMGVTFLVLLAAFWLVYYYPFEADGRVARAYAAYLHGYAYATAAVIRVHDPLVSVTDATISGRFAMRVSRDCDGTQVLLLYTAALLAFPATWRGRACGLAVGLPMLAGINVCRLCNLYWLGEHWPLAFEYAHAEVWPVVLCSCALAAFGAWAIRVASPEA